MNLLIERQPTNGPTFLFHSAFHFPTGLQTYLQSRGRLAPLDLPLSLEQMNLKNKNKSQVLWFKSDRWSMHFILKRKYCHHTFVHVSVGVCVHPLAMFLVLLEVALVAFAVLVRGDTEAVLLIQYPAALVAIAISPGIHT